MIDLALSKSILEKARALKDSLVKDRRHIHANPELSFQEQQTAAYVSDKLKGFTNVRVRTGVGETGVLAEIGKGDRIIGIRADMDALPILENNPQEYCSKNANVMHACGHDAHTAAALGAVSILSELESAGKLNGCYRFIFQPAEEAVNDEGLSGASMMMQDGCVDGLDALLAIHVHPGMPTGTYGFREGSFLAACDSFEITIRGGGGHGGYPENTVDTVVLASNLVQNLQTIISRRKSALAPAVLSIGGIRSNTFRPNIIAEEVALTGTVRYFSPELSQFFEEEISKTARLAEAFGATVAIKYKRENPALINDSKVTTTVRDVACALLGDQAIVSLPQELGAEDFSFYTLKVPATFAIVGCGIAGSPREIHTPNFDIDEDALVYAAALLAAGAMSL